MLVTAVQKFVRTSPRKLRLVVPVIKDMPPQTAVEILPHVGKRAAGPLNKVLKTAIANAKVQGFGESDLVIKEIQIGEGPRLKRWHAGARGRVKPYQRKMSHIKVVLETKEKKEKKSTTQKIKSRIKKQSNNQKNTKVPSTEKGKK